LCLACNGAVVVLDQYCLKPRYSATNAAALRATVASAAPQPGGSSSLSFLTCFIGFYIFVFFLFFSLCCYRDFVSVFLSTCVRVVSASLAGTLASRVELCGRGFCGGVVFVVCGVEWIGIAGSHPRLQAIRFATGLVPE